MEIRCLGVFPSSRHPHSLQGKTTSRPAPAALIIVMRRAAAWDHQLRDRLGSIAPVVPGTAGGVVVIAGAEGMEAEEVGVISPAGSGEDIAWSPLRRLWAEGTEEVVPQVRWWTEGTRFVWEMKCPLPLAERKTFAPTGFIEGLWEQDLAECFMLDRRTGHYQEFNLGPGGAWWSARFSAPRVRIAPQPSALSFGVLTEVEWTAAAWIGRLSFPVPDLGSAAVNFTAIVASSEGRRFYSLAPLGGSRPDFHRPADWISL